VENRPQVRQFYREFLELRPEMLIVDVGCGTGHFTRYLTSLITGRCQTIGIDARVASINSAARETRQLGLSDRVSYKQGDVYQLPIQSDFADLTCCRTVLMHLTDPRRAVAEMARITKPGGTVAAIEPGQMRSFYDPEDNRFSLLDNQMGLAYLTGMRKLEGKEFGIGEQLPSIFSSAGLRELRIEIRADAWMPCDARLKKDQARQMLEYTYLLFKEGKKDERRILRAGGVPPRKIRSYLNQCERWYIQLLSDREKLTTRTLVISETSFVITGRKTTEN
jgi:ubiquinone/menaquinone biosynthesis C-methylase UbiE